MSHEIGYAWLAKEHDINPVQPLIIRSQIGTTRKSVVEEGRRLEVYTETMRPETSMSSHLTFALKHEGVHLEFLSRLFSICAPEALIQWIASEPTGQYARRSGFLYEWLTGKILNLEEIAIGGNYRDALDPQRYVTSEHKKRNARWRINDNLPGTPAFCPLVRRTEQVVAATEYDCRKSLQAVEAEFGEDILHRSAIWLTVRESRASFAIEHEGQKTDRIQRFATAIAQYCGELGDPLSPEALSVLQEAILGKSTIQWGIRQSPIFVGSSSLQDGPVVHYVSPRWDWLADMLHGLKTFLERTSADQAMVRAAVASFGFVFIHPLADGNGRVSRFLINDSLRRDGMTPSSVVLPISATITQSAGKRLEYDRILERYSKPLMARYNEWVRFGDRTRYPDGVESDMHFAAYPSAEPVWRYPDLTAQTEYLFDVIRETVEREMPAQASLQRAWYRTRDAIKDYLEGPDDHIDRIIRGVRTNGRIGNKLRKEFPALEDTELADNVERVISEGFVDVIASSDRG